MSAESSEAARSTFPAAAWCSELFCMYRELVAPTTESPVEFLWGSLAAALGFLVGGDCAIPWGPGFLRPTLYVALIGDTAKGRKSTALNDVLDVAVRPTLERMKLDTPALPFEVMTGMGSGEGFFDVIADRHDGPGDERQGGRRALVVLHELGELLAKVGRGQAGCMLDFLLNAFEAPREFTMHTRDRRVKATNATVSLATASTLEWLVQNLPASIVMNGFINRFVLLQGERGHPLPFRPQLDSTLQEAFRRRLYETLASIQGQALRFSSDAVSCHAGHYEEEYNRPSRGGLVDAASARCDALALRIAALLAIGDGTLTIDGRHVDAAWMVAKYSAGVAESLVERIEARTIKEVEDRILAHADKAAKKAVEAGGDASFTKRSVFQRLKGKSGLSAEEFERGWRALHVAGELVAVDESLNRFRLEE
jgi:hypothetical protein